MPVVQITYDVPLDIARGLNTGDLSMLGTAAVRNNRHITAHIREISRTITDGDEPAAAALAARLRDPRIVVLGLGVAAVAAVGGTLFARNRRQRATAESAMMPECVSNYNASLAEYLGAIGSGSLDKDVITRLISDLDVLKENAELGTITLELSVEDSERLVDTIADYTTRLAEANAVEISDLDSSQTDTAEARIVDMRRYLVAQQRIFDQSA